MYSLEDIRLIVDVIKISKIVHGIDKVNLRKDFCVNEDRGIRKHT